MRKSTSDLCSLCSVTSLCSLGVGVRAVELLPADLVSHGSDLEASTLLVVEDGRKYARRVEARQAQPVDRPVRSPVTLWLLFGCFLLVFMVRYFNVGSVATSSL